MSHAPIKRPVRLSIAVMAGARADALESTLAALFRQSVFDRFAARHEACEVFVLVTDGSADVIDAARRTIAGRAAEPAPAAPPIPRVIALAGVPRSEAWNRFVHEFSALEARALVTLEADILLHHRDAIWSLVTALERRGHVAATSGRRCEDVLFKERRTFWERLAVATSPPDAGRTIQLNGEFVCVRADAARRVRLPPGLGEGFGGFLTEVLGTNFFATRFEPTRIALPPAAAYICAAQVGPRNALESWKARMIGQTAAHVLCEYLRTRSARERSGLLELLREHEAADPEWLEKLIAAHVRRRRFFGQLFPGVLRMHRQRLPGWRRVRQIPEACAGFVLKVIACLRAHRSLRARPAARALESAADFALSGPRSDAR